ncbi:MAG TPA: threonine/serine dehydratase [Gammaproteobacteria bacterium]|nr:threonine/serine dehydratase [Gammaproteobacteria bacterium]
MDIDLPLEEIRDTRRRLGDWVTRTPVHVWRSMRIEAYLGEAAEVWLKLELLQRTGTFKPRGALSNLLDLDERTLERGVTAVSAGNHAIATAYAARTLGTSAKVVMIRTANPFRVEQCRRYGAEVVFAESVHTAFDLVREIEREEGRFFVHPFEGLRTTLGTATVGLEWCEQVADMDAVIVPIGGGGLCAGIATAVKHLQPACQVFGVEPEGADSMHRSFAAGKAVAIERVNTIADSLAAPHAAPFSFALCRRHVDELVKITDDDMRGAMRLIFEELKFAVEPACAAATAALLGPLRERLAGRRAGVILCGSNIDLASFQRLVNEKSPDPATSP